MSAAAAARIERERMHGIDRRREKEAPARAHEENTADLAEPVNYILDFDVLI